MNKGIFPALDDFNSFVVGLLIKSGSDVEYLISYWNQLVSNLPFDEFVTINLYNQCYDDDILGRSIEAKGFTHNSRAIDQSNVNIIGYIDIGDGCWRRNVLVTT